MALSDSKVDIEGVVFEFSKLPAMRGFRVMERCRVAMAKTDVGSIDAGTSKDFVKMGREGAMAAFKALACLDEGFVEGLRKDLFTTVTFTSLTSDGRPQPPQVLGGMEDMAFESLEPSHIYEVMLRSFVVNFSGSWSVAVSRFPSVATLAGGTPSKL